MNDVQRAGLVEAHRPLVWKAVRAIWPRVAGYVEKAELVSLGDLGLVEAAARFDPDGGASFATFAWYRVQGAILDGLRRAAALPRRVWAQLCALRAAGEYLEAQARQEAAARARGAAEPDTRARLAAVRDAMGAIEVMYSVAARATFEEAEETAPDPGPRPDEAADRALLRRRLDGALGALPERERALLHKHYVEGKNLLEAGAELGLSKSWASRLHAQAVDRLRRAMGAVDTS